MEGKASKKKQYGSPDEYEVKIARVMERLQVEKYN
jgi:hypothetical protein